MQKGNEMKKITVDATLENLGVIIDFIDKELERIECSEIIQMQIAIAVEEIYVNIAHYAYNPEVGVATIVCTINEDTSEVIIQFLDSGKPYDPLKKKDADITLSAEEREIGGLGILMVKKSMDFVDYRYEDGKNILTITKLT